MTLKLCKWAFLLGYDNASLKCVVIGQAFVLLLFGFSTVSEWSEREREDEKERW